MYLKLLLKLDSSADHTLLNALLNISKCYPQNTPRQREYQQKLKID